MNALPPIVQNNMKKKKIRRKNIDLKDFVVKQNKENPIQTPHPSFSQASYEKIFHSIKCNTSKVTLHRQSNCSKSLI